MAVPEQTPYVEYDGNGVSKVFPLTFDCKDSDHLIVLVNDVEPSHGSWSLDATTDTVTFILPPVAGSTIKIQRDTPMSRSTQYQSYNNSFRPASVDDDFDTIWRKMQELGVLNWLANNNIKDLNEYVDSLNDETKAIFVSMIEEQGLSLAQLDGYVDRLYKKLANTAIDKGWLAEFIADASGLNQQEINNEYAQRFKTVADPRNFGSPNNGFSDDAPGIREAIAFLDSLGGGELYMVSNIKWIVKSLHSNNLDALVISNVIRVNFGNKITTLEVGTDMRSVFKLSDGYQGFIDFYGGILQGKKLTDYILYGDPSNFTPYMQITGTQCRSAKEYAASINPYMSQFDNAHFSFSPGGLLLNNKNAVAEITSTQLNACYANGCEEFGFKAHNRLMYARLDSCGVDDCGGIAYDLDMQGGSITNCGAERVVKLLRMPNVNDGVSVTGMVGIGVGSLDANSPADAAIEIAGSGSLPNHLNGIRLLSHPTQQRYRDTDLLVRASQNKYPRVITDSFARARTRVITEAGVTPIFDEPIIFTVSAFRKDGIETIETQNLKARLDELNKSELKFKYTIQLTQGSEDSEKLIEGIHGAGVFTIQGVDTDNTKANLRGGRLGLTIRNCSATIIIRYVTFENNAGYADSALAQITVDNCRDVIVDTVGFSTSKHALGTAIRATNNSHVKIRGETIADNGHAANTVYQAQTGSTIEIEPRNAPPAIGKWAIGQRIENSNIGTGNIIEWVYMRNAGDTANEWRAITV